MLGEMAVARHILVHPETTPYYHCITRCVRRAFLCGEDVASGKNFDHRKQWVVEKLQQLSKAFCIDICAYAVMSNHLHLVLRINQAKASALSNEALLKRYGILFPRSVEAVKEMPTSLQKKRLAVFRERISSLSWFMRCLNESIARRANKEDRCTGRFWEGRFRSQALLDEAALLTCMAYVDLNPVRAGLASSLEASDFTSIQQRLFRAAQKKRSKQKNREEKSKTQTNQESTSHTKTGRRTPKLMPFSRKQSENDFSNDRLPVCFSDYVELVRCTGEIIRHGKKGVLSPSSTRLLTQAGIASEQWAETVTTFHQGFSNMVGQTHRIDAQCKRLGQSKTKGVGFAKKAFAKVA